MRAARVATHQTCNQACVYCIDRRSVDDPAFTASRAVLGRVVRALSAGAEEIVFTGGEPTMRSDLPILVRKSREAGAGRTTLETNATLVDDPLAKKLRAAGLDRAVVHIPGPGAQGDAISRDPGGFDRAMRGARALSAAGIEIDLSVVVSRSSAPTLSQIPSAISAALPGVRVGTVWMSVASSAPSDDEILPLDEAARALIEAEAAFRAAGFGAKLHPAGSVPPCLFEARHRPHHLYSMTPGSSGDLRPQHRRVPECDACAVRERCGGMPARPLELHGVPKLHPPSTDKAKRRLAFIGTLQEQIARELVSPNLTQGGDGARYEEIIRVNFHCNQACEFCFVSTHLPSASEDTVRDAIRSAAAKGARITLSGGEPTLNPRLEEYVALARSLSEHPVQLQTNAVRLDDAALTDRLVAAGVEEVFVSLHGATAEVSDAVTSAPGTFVRTIVGVDHLVAAGARVVLNFVLCQKNLHELVPTVRLVAARWPSLPLSISFVAASTDLVPRSPELVPRYRDAMPRIGEALALAEELGLQITGFESMCGLPLCLVPSQLSRFVGLIDLPQGFDQGEFMKPDACTRCALEKKCFGVRRGYVELYDASELAPVAATETLAAR